MLHRPPHLPRNEISPLMGHSSGTTTERYSYLRPALFGESAFGAMNVDLSRPAGDVVPLPPAPGKSESRTATQQDITEGKPTQVTEN